MSKLAAKATKIRHFDSVARYELIEKNGLETDRDDIIRVAGDMLNLTRCCGGHRIAEGYRCPHCGSGNPSEFCRREKVATSMEEIEESVNPLDLEGWRIVRI